MAGFLYFVPGRQTQVNAGDLAGLGLAHIATSQGGPESRGISNAGPDGGGGFLVVPTHPASPPSMFQRAEQTWHRGPKFWVGWLTASPPTPADLVRDTVMGGTGVKLRDGNEWMIPRIHAVFPGRPTNLPRVFGADDSGDWAPKIAPEYEGVCERAHRWWRAFLRLDGESVTEADLLDLAVDVLALNYRVSKAEVAAMGLIGDAELARIGRVIIDGDEIEARVKKN